MFSWTLKFHNIGLSTVCEDAKTPWCHNRVKIFTELCSGTNKCQTLTTSGVIRSKMFPENTVCKNIIPILKPRLFRNAGETKMETWEQNGFFPQLNPPFKERQRDQTSTLFCSKTTRHMLAVWATAEKLQNYIFTCMGDPLFLRKSIYFG